ncbi:MAG: ligase-associated DNA damage response endonuclease PdeM [Pseudomonadota bacterium]|nr:ligase-associated DNA damage response endonuclease PdeM [Pseudomonadota bacterium]
MGTSSDSPPLPVSAPVAGHGFALAGAALVARPSGALWRPERRLLAVADLHLGKSERLARRGGALLPPYETEATLDRLDAEIAALDPAEVICLGDSFDDPAAAAGLAPQARTRLEAMAAGRRWIWAEGNHDPGPNGITAPGMVHVAEWRDGPLVFRHIAARETTPGTAEVSGHYHPTGRLPGGGGARPCFVLTGARLILPAFGAFTGGLCARDPAIRALAPAGLALLLGPRVTPVPRAARRPIPRLAARA